MPDGQRDPDARARLYNVYMRPWTLLRGTATAAVPHLADLDKIAGKPAGHAASWSWYLRGHVVSEHAATLIAQFMAACCGRSTGDAGAADESEEVAQREPPPDNTVPLGRVRGVIAAMARYEAADPGAHTRGGESRRTPSFPQQPPPDSPTVNFLISPMSKVQKFL